MSPGSFRLLPFERPTTVKLRDEIALMTAIIPSHGPQSAMLAWR